MAFSWMSSFFIHALPSWDDSPIGGHFIPLFYTPLLIVLLRRNNKVVILSMLIPWINYILLGLPHIEKVVLLELELACFFFFAEILKAKSLSFKFVGPIAYTASLITVGILGSMISYADINILFSIHHVFPAIMNAGIGIGILFFIGFFIESSSKESSKN